MPPPSPRRAQARHLISLFADCRKKRQNGRRQMAAWQVAEGTPAGAVGRTTRARNMRLALVVLVGGAPAAAAAVVAIAVAIVCLSAPLPGLAQHGDGCCHSNPVPFAISLPSPPPLPKRPSSYLLAPRSLLLAPPSSPSPSSPSPFPFSRPLSFSSSPPSRVIARHVSARGRPHHWIDDEERLRRQRHDAIPCIDSKDHDLDGSAALDNNNPRVLPSPNIEQRIRSSTRNETRRHRYSFHSFIVCFSHSFVRPHIHSHARCLPPTRHHGDARVPIRPSTPHRSAPETDPRKTLRQQWFCASQSLLPTPSFATATPKLSTSICICICICIRLCLCPAVLCAVCCAVLCCALPCPAVPCPCWSCASLVLFSGRQPPCRIPPRAAPCVDSVAIAPPAPTVQVQSNPFRLCRIRQIRGQSMLIDPLPTSQRSF